MEELTYPVSCQVASLGLTCTVRFEDTLGGCDRLVESPRLDLSLKKFIKLSRGSTKFGRLVLRLTDGIQMIHIPRGFRNQEPNGQGERRTAAGEEPTGLQAPVPLMSVGHIWNKYSHHQAYDTG